MKDKKEKKWKQIPSSKSVRLTPDEKRQIIDNNVSLGRMDLDKKLEELRHDPIIRRVRDVAR